MAKLFADRVRVAIDIGTTKICVLVAQHLVDDSYDIIGIGKVPSHGLKKGVVVDIAQTIRSIKDAVKEAELASGITIESAVIGISGGHITALNSHGVVPIKRGQVSDGDIASALAAAQAIPIPDGQQVLHVLPQYYLLDGHDIVQDPRGMHGVRLEVHAHIILGAVASVQNLITCCESAGVRVTDIILEQLASADAVLSRDEKELGVGVLDIGGGTSDLALYQNGTIRHTMVLPVAGNHFTNDIALGLRTTIGDAERIKKQYGVAQADVIIKDEIIEIECLQGKGKDIILQSHLVDIIQPRAQELLNIIHDELVKLKLQRYLATGLVLTGGGSLLLGMKELAESIFKVSVRIGYPSVNNSVPSVLNSPMYATAYGLLVHSGKKDIQSDLQMQGPLVKRIALRMKSWVVDLF